KVADNLGDLRSALKSCQQLYRAKVWQAFAHASALRRKFEAITLLGTISDKSSTDIRQQMVLRGPCLGRQSCWQLPRAKFRPEKLPATFQANFRQSRVPGLNLGPSGVRA